MQQVQGHQVSALGVTPSLMGDLVELIDLRNHVAVTHNLKGQALHVGVGMLRPDCTQFGQRDRSERR